MKSSEETEQTLDPTAINRLMRPPMICLCRHVPEQQIRSAVRNGADSFVRVQMETGCSTGCGTCEGRVRMIIEDEKKKLQSGLKFT